MSNYIQYETADAVATITLDRADRRNAQNQPLLEELNEAWERAAADNDVRVILLRANGPHFSAGHDMSPESVKSNPAFGKISGSMDLEPLKIKSSSETVVLVAGVLAKSQLKAPAR